jgi:hypothetical protein
MALGVLAVILAGFKLTDPTQALGLPEGTVRSVIALALVLLFAILSVFLYSDLARGGVNTVANLTSDQKDLMVKNIPSVELVAVAGPKAEDPNKGTYEVTYRVRNAASEDFAKQLLVMIGTLVTAVAAFYFGAKTATSAQAAAADALKGASATATVHGVTPASTVLPAKGQPATNLPIKITGAGLNDTVKVAFKMDGGSPIVAANVTSAGDSISCTLPIADVTPTGTYDVVVTDNAANDAIGLALFTISAPASGGGDTNSPDGGGSTADTDPTVPPEKG